MAQRTFGSIKPTAKARPSFKLQGLYEYDVTGPDGAVVAKEDDPWEEEFTCLRVVPSGPLDVLIGSVGTNADGSFRFNQLQVCKFLAECLLPESKARFEALLRDTARAVDFTDLMDALDWLAGPLLGRPTTPPSS